MMQLAQRAANRLKDLLYVRGTARAHLQDARGKVACLLYHRVVDPEEDRFEFLTRGGVPAIAPRELASDIAFLAQNGAKFFTFEDLQESFPSNGEFGVIICFDDCFRDNYEAGRAVLEEQGVRGVFFQTSSLVDRRDLLWEHALYWCGRTSTARRRLRQLGHLVLNEQHAASMQHADDVITFLREHVPFEHAEAVLKCATDDAGFAWGLLQAPDELYPSRQHVRAARSVGHEIGSHGHEHLMRTNISTRLFEEDLARSRDVLAYILGDAPHSYSYPFSSHVPGDESICAKFFKIAAVVKQSERITKQTDQYRIPRFTWPGPARNRLRQRRWLLSGAI